MVAYFLLGVFMLAGLLLLGRWFVSVSPANLARGIKWGLGIVAALLIGYLALSGRLAVALGAVAGIIPFILRWARLLLFLRQAFNFRRFFKKGSAGSGAGSGANSGGKGGQGRSGQEDSSMSREEAWQVLGLKEGASEAEINAAHHRLIAASHPDQGGSNWLASRINQARDVLLGK